MQHAFLCVLLWFFVPGDTVPERNLQQNPGPRFDESTMEETWKTQRSWGHVCVFLHHIVCFGWYTNLNHVS